VHVHAELVDAVLDTKRNEAVGQFDLFSSADDAPGLTGGAEAGPGAAAYDGLDVSIPIGEWDKSVLLSYEREMLGLYVSDHPLLGVEHVLAAAVDCPVSELADAEDGRVVTVGGILSAVTRKVTKLGKTWATVTLEDLEGGIEVMFFPNSYELAAPHLVEDTVVLVKGKIDTRDDALKLVAMELTLPDLAQGPRGPLLVNVAAARCTAELVERLKDTLKTHPGTTDVHLRLVGSKVTELRLDDSLRVTASPSLMADLKALLGAGCLPPS
jgi:DNA polymerase-3 subunit alpha